MEFALVLPLLLMLTLGIIDFSRYYYSQSVLTNVAFEGARAAALAPTTAAPIDKAKAAITAAGGSLDVDTSTVSVVFSTGTRCSAGQYVTVTVYTRDVFNFTLPFLNQSNDLTSNSGTLNGKLSAKGSYQCFG